MSQKYTFSTGLGTVPLAAPPITLSDGTLVIAYFTSAVSPAGVTLAYTVDRVSLTTIASLPAANVAGSFYPAAGQYRGVGLCRDADDNLYVVSQSGGTSTSPLFRAYAKGAGLTWTASATVSTSGGNAGTEYLLAWANTGGGTSGAGHLLCMQPPGTGSVGVNVYAWDAGKILAGTATSPTTFTSLGGSNYRSNGFDFDQDGFGSTTFLMARYGVSTGTLDVASGVVSAAGGITRTVLTSGISLTSTSTRVLRVIRYASNAWAILTCGVSNANNYSVGRYSSTSQLTAMTDVTPPAGLPALGNSVQWDAFLDPQTSNRVWIITPDSTNGNVWIGPVNLSSGVSAGSTATLTDTFSPWSSLSGTPQLYALKRSSTSTTVDWLAYIATTSSTASAGVGDYTQFNVAPNAPTLTSPADSSTIDLTSTNRFRWTFSDPDSGDSQSKFDLRYSSNGGSTWTTVTGSTPNQYVDIAGGTFTAGSYQWQVRTYDALGVVGPYSASRFFTAATPPSGLTITAPTSGEVIGSASHLVTWSAPSQDSYQVRTVADNAGAADATTIYTDTGEVVSSSARSATVAFATNGLTEHVQVRVKVSGLWSSWADVTVSVSYTAPATPTVTVVAGTSTIGVVTSQPTPTGSQPTVSYVDIYRRDVGDPGSGNRYATEQAPSGTWTDYRVASGQGYQYRVRAFGSNGTYTDSAWTA